MGVQKITLVPRRAAGVQPDDGVRLDHPPPVESPSLEDKARWFLYADIALRKEEAKRILAEVREEQEGIKRRIRQAVNNYKRFKKRSKRA
jgi:hypothetical protein